MPQKQDSAGAAAKKGAPQEEGAPAGRNGKAAAQGVQPSPSGVNQNYLNYVKSLAPPTKHFHNCFRAFIVGGLICCVGQFLRTEFEYLLGDRKSVV